MLGWVGLREIWSDALCYDATDKMRSDEMCLDPIKLSYAATVICFDELCVAGLGSDMFGFGRISSDR